MQTRKRIGRRLIGSAFLVGIGVAGLAAAGGDLILPDGNGRVPEPQVTSPEGRVAGSGAAPYDASMYGPKGRYSTLLRKIEVPNDQQSYGDFYDYGYYTGTSYAGHSDLPAGYWVYLSPHWYIYRDAQGVTPVANVSFSPTQATGKPNTPEPGDYSTAWASATADSQREWLELTYDGEIEAVGVMIYETYNPGAVDSVIASVGNETVEVWAGKDPTEAGKPKGISVMGFKTAVKTSKIRVNIDSPRVPGWNEIDAVGLLDKEGNVHWASGAKASSTWGSGQQGFPVEVPPATTERRLSERTP